MRSRKDTTSTSESTGTTGVPAGSTLLSPRRSRTNKRSHSCAKLTSTILKSRRLTCPIYWLPHAARNLLSRGKPSAGETVSNTDGTWTGLNIPSYQTTYLAGSGNTCGILSFLENQSAVRLSWTLIVIYIVSLGYGLNFAIKVGTHSG